MRYPVTLLKNCWELKTGTYNNNNDTIYADILNTKDYILITENILTISFHRITFHSYISSKNNCFVSF